MRSLRTRNLRGGLAAAFAVVLAVVVPATAAGAAGAPDTKITSGPAASTASASASFTFTSSKGATFGCGIDGAALTSCTSPATYSGLAAGAHTFAVAATVKGVTDPSPATYPWRIDTTAPTAPTNLAATSPSSTSVSLTWTAGTDDVAVTGNDIYRDGVKLVSVGAVTTYTDTTVKAGSSHSYAVVAKDGAGNASALSNTVATGAAVDPSLTRSPYLTDLVGQGVTVNFATDRSGSVASVRYGLVGTGGACTPSTSVDASKIVVAVGTIYEYQWKARLNLPAAGSYCYRPYLGTTDLLGGTASPQFATQVPVGSTQAFSFAVFGDWGQAYAPSGNTNQANLLAKLATSGVRFAVTTGDNGYPAGSQLNYGDLQQSGADVSAIFGPGMWGVPGASIPVFPAIGNHGLARGDAIHPHFGIWPQDVAVATSGGSYTSTDYPSVNGSAPATYPSPWYAFDAGNARFYVLDAAWADLNTGTATPYANEAASHWTPSSAEYQWLQKDLAAHPSGLKFAFFHYPLYSDQPSESSDTSLQGAGSLEGLLTTYGVNIAFQGHAHIYQRSVGMNGLVSYLTGGGGAKAQSTGTCSANDKAAVGWSYTNNRGTHCGSAPTPSSDAQVYHFLKVTVNGSKVTVTPTDSTGRTFDVQSYTFNSVNPDTFIDSSPPAGSTSSTATFTFHASSGSATFACSLDSATASACTSPKTYTGLAQGAHTFSVAATVNRVTDPQPATYSWTVDSTAPTTPGGFAASAQSPFAVATSWSASTDNTGVTGYDLFRDGTLYQSLGPVTSYTDTAVLASSTHTYAVRARDVAGNTSPMTTSVSVTTPAPAPPVFADGFESGTLSQWKPTAGLTVQGTTVHGGSYAAEGNTQNGGAYAKVTLPGSYGDSWSRVWFNVLAQPSQVNLLRLRDTAGSSLGYVYVETTGQLGFHDDATGTNTLSSTIPGPGWHALELHLRTGASAGALGAAEIWLDNTRVDDLSSTAVDVGSAAVSILQIGEVQSGQTYDVAYDDVAFGTSRLGPTGDSAPPSDPGAVTASAQSAFSVGVSWTASTDDVAVAGYDVYRDGALVGSVPAPLTSFSDSTVLASTTYHYAVQARDTSGNLSARVAAPAVTTPAPAPPVFVDGFESGGLGAWTTNSGLTVQSTVVHAGAYAAEGSSPTGVTWAKKTLPGGPYADAYARVAFRVQSLGSQTTLLRLRDTATGVGGYVFLTTTGKLGFRSDALAAATTSATSAGPGWHVLELHLHVGSSAGALGTAEVWLDDVPVTDLSSSSIDVGSSPVGVLQIGDTAGNGTGTGWDVLYDDVAFGTDRLGGSADGTAPSVPGNVTAVADSPFSVQIAWDASTDDTGVTGYDLLRDGVAYQSLGAVTSYTDTAVVHGSTYTYALRARDLAGNVSAPSTPASVTVPDPPPPVFADGFESGDLSAWTSAAGLTVQSGAVHSGQYAAEGIATNGGISAKKTLAAGYSDVYARVWVTMKTLPNGNVGLLRLRDTAAGSVGNIFITSAGKLGFSTTGVSTTSAVTLGTGWHALEMHVAVNGASSSYEVWLDGAPVAALSGTADLSASGPVTILQLGDSAATTGRTFDVVYDDAAVSTSRLGT